MSYRKVVDNEVTGIAAIVDIVSPGASREIGISAFIIQRLMRADR